MDAEVLRQKLMIRIDALLGRWLLVGGEDRALLSAMRGYVAQMPAAELDRLATYMTRAEADGPAGEGGCER